MGGGVRFEKRRRVERGLWEMLLRCFLRNDIVFGFGECDCDMKGMRFCERV